MKHARWLGRAGAAWYAAVMLAACGGGSSPSAPPSLLPSAPPAGDVLYADASVLRPLSAGASYEYRGVTVLGTNYVPRIYRNTVSQSAAAANTILETSSNWFNQGSDTMPVEAVGGDIRLRQLIDLDGVGAPQPQEVIELRSPIRQSDQYTVLDHHFPEAIQDLDGDGKLEAVDMAAYRRVVRNEVVELENLPARVALRVDFVTLVRVQLSRDGKLGPVVQVVQRTWYAPGIGVVKQQLDLPMQGLSTERTTHTELLMSWDGVTAGLGFTSPRAANAPADTASAAGAALQGLAALTRHEQGAAVVTMVNDDSGATRRALGLIDANGRVSKLALLTEWESNSLLPILASTGGSVALILGRPIGGGYNLSSFDNDLRPRTPAPGVPLDLGPSDTSVAWHLIEAVESDGQLLWVLYRRSFADGRKQLLLRAFDLTARPVGVEYLLEDLASSQGLGPAAFSASPQRIVATWTSSRSVGQEERRYAVLSSGSITPIFGTLTNNVSRTDVVVQPSSAGPQAALSWAGPLESNVGNDNELRCVSLSEDGSPVRTTAGPLDSEKLVGNWQAGLSSRSFPRREDSNRLVFVLATLARPWSDVVRETRLLQVVVIQRCTGASPQAEPARVLRIPPELTALYGDTWRSSDTILLEDRLLMLSYGDGGHLKTAVVWHR